jgi:hypothetical protein
MELLQLDERRDRFVAALVPSFVGTGVMTNDLWVAACVQLFLTYQREST